MTRIFASVAIAGAALVAAVPSIGAAAQATDRTQLQDNFATSSGQSYTLSQLGAEEADRGTVRDNEQLVVHPGIVVAVPGTATIAAFPPQNVAQLIADGDLTPAQAKGMTLSQVAEKKFLRDNSM